MRRDDFSMAVHILADASTYVDVFGECSPPFENSLKVRYRQLAKAVHPDRVSEARRAEAAISMSRLNALYQAAQEAVGAGTFGKLAPLLVVRSARAIHEAHRMHSPAGDMTDVYTATTTFHSGERLDTLLKVARTPKDNDLLMAEQRALERLKAGSEEHAMFYPEVLDSFQAIDGRMRRNVTVLRYMEGFMNLTQVKTYRPDGLHPLDAAWIWRRLLWALGGAHEQKLIHGAVLPQHIIIHPRMHGVLLVDWCYSVAHSAAPKAVVASRNAWYPTSVFAKAPADESIDLSMAARTMVYLLGGDPVSMNMPRTVPAIMQRYLVRIVAGKSQTAYELLGQFDDLLRQLGAPYYPRSYRELILN